MARTDNALTGARRRTNIANPDAIRSSYDRDVARHAGDLSFLGSSDFSGV
jgi:hypothetical protein